MKFQLIAVALLAVVLVAAYMVFEGGTSAPAGNRSGSSNELNGFKIP